MDLSESGFIIKQDRRVIITDMGAFVIITSRKYKVVIKNIGAFAVIISNLAKKVQAVNNVV